jgi:hypothetical protein
MKDSHILYCGKKYGRLTKVIPGPFRVIYCHSRINVVQSNRLHNLKSFLVVFHLLLLWAPKVIKLPDLETGDEGGYGSAWGRSPSGHG